MEWMVVNPLQIHSTFASLGVQVGDTYCMNEDCFETLEEILKRLEFEDKSLRTFRRALGFSQVIKKDLLPLLVNVKDDCRIIDATIRILVSLTIPIECLLPIEVFDTDSGHQIIFELNKLLTSGKEAFSDSKSTRAVLDYMKLMLEKDDKLSDEDCNSINNCLLLLRNILHIPESRGNNTTAIHSNLQNQILWNLFTHSIDKILIHLMTCAHRAKWDVAMVQLIALMYKDQHVGTLQNLLRIWFEASLSESSEDNESNTSPPEQGNDSSPMVTSDPTSDSSDNNSSSPNNRMTAHCNKIDFKSNITDPTAGKQMSSRKSPHCDSNKAGRKNCCEPQRKNQTASRTVRKSIGKAFNKKDHRCDSDEIQPGHQLHSEMRISAQHSQGETTNCSKKDCPQSASELSDYGYATQVENQESISTSSNEDDSPNVKRHVHQKLHPNQKVRFNNKPKTLLQVDKTELRRKKLVKRSRSGIMNMKALLHHTPTDEDISNLLKEFTVDFLVKGYGCLVQDLFTQLLSSNNMVQVDTSHFFWLVTYFLKFAAQLELELEHINTVLSYSIISYLTYEGVSLCEELELCFLHPESDFKPRLRRLHLVVTAIREFIQAIEMYQKMSHLSLEDREYLQQLQVQVASTEDLKFLFLLLLRHYNPNFQSKQYLQDLIATNHILLLFLDHASKLPGCVSKTDMMQHIKQFATVEVMHQYGVLLEDFKDNGEFVNNCVFTMMHHVGGDLEKAIVLFQPNILKSFSKIWEMEFEVCDDWSDLIEYVIHQFVNYQKHLTEPMQNEEKATAVNRRWSKDDFDNLYWFYAQAAKCSDPINRIQKMYEDIGIDKSRIEIIQQLLAQKIVTQHQYTEFMKHEIVKPLEWGKEKDDSYKINNASELETKSEHQEKVFSNLQDEISSLKDHLLQNKQECIVSWLQKYLTEVCYVKLVMENPALDDPKLIMEPVAYHFALMNRSIPVVPWNTDQDCISWYPPFLLLLHKLGFHLPADTGKIFIRIPHFWSADFIFNIAQKLGPIDSCTPKFDVNLLQNVDRLKVDEDGMQTSPMIRAQNKFLFANPQQTSSMIRCVPQPTTSNNWLKLVAQSKKANIAPRIDSEIQKEESMYQIARGNSAAKVRSVTSDNGETISLAYEQSQMSVSDEEDKQIVKPDKPVCNINTSD